METMGHIREAVGVFDNSSNLDAAIAELEGTAFPRHDISVLASAKEISKKFGTDSVMPEWVEDSSESPRGISVRPEEKTIGSSALIGCLAYIFGCGMALAAHDSPMLILIAAITAGSIVGGLIGFAIVTVFKARIDARNNRQIKKGGLLLWVRTPDTDREKIAQDILRRNGGRHIHIHSVA